MRRFFSLLVLSLPLAACSVGDTSTVDDVKANPYAMPKAILTYETQMGWNKHHIKWHTERQWGLLGPSDRTWASKQGWKAAKIQEGKPGNGLEFLAMHRVMIRTLVGKFPKNASLLNGWTTIPTDPKDANAPPSSEPFSDAMKAAIDKLENHPEDFASDDALGVYLETKLRPTSHDVAHRTTDTSAGIHNYVHNRFSDSSSSIDLGDPSLNLQNKIFWRLHGWIDARWTAYRKAKGLSETDPDYVAALKAAEAEMMDSMPVSGSKGLTAEEPPPDSLRKMFENQDN